MEPLHLAVTMMPVTRYRDGSVGIKCVTVDEVGPEQFAHIDAYRQTNGWLLFGPNQFSDSELPKEDVKVEKGELTPADRQRKALYKLFMLRGGKPENFGSFYREQMAVFQSIITDKIEDEENKSNALDSRK